MKLNFSKLKLSTIEKARLNHVMRAILGGLAICLGVIASRLCPYPELAPLLFSTGILLVMAFDLHLITRHFPAQKLDWWITPVVIVFNLFAAYVAGLFSPLELTVIPDNLFVQSIFGGIVIGLVSRNHLVDSPYRVPIALLLMYIFVMLGLPHCVVYAFLNVDFATLLIVLAGNISGGLLLRIGLHYAGHKIKKIA